MSYLKLSLSPQKINSRLRLFGFVTGIVAGFIVAVIILNYLPDSRISPAASNVLSTEDTRQPATDYLDLNTLGILLLGYGGPGHQGGFLTDAIQLVFVDFTKSAVSLISLPRDLWVKYPLGEGKINAVYSKLSPKDSKKFFSSLLGLPVDYFIAIDFVGFQRAIGIVLKGIEVEVSQTLDDPWYPVAGRELDTCGLTAKEVAQLSAKYSGFELERQFPCRYEHLYFEKGLVKMQGGEALKYVRSRHGSQAGDISRNIRQQEVLTAIKKKMLDLNSLKDLPGFFNEIMIHLNTDIDMEIVKYLSPAIQNARDFKVNYVNLSTENILATGTVGGAAVIQPKAGLHNWLSIQEYIKSQITK